MGFKKPVVNKISTNIEDLTIYIRTLKKFGKTTLFRDVVLEKYNDPQKGLLVGIGAESGYALLDNLNTTQVETWQELVDLKDWLISEKGNEHDIKIVGFDVVDEMIPIVEKEVCRLSKIETKKECKSINGAFGGYGAGQEIVKQMIKDYFTELKKNKIGVWGIAHTKYKSVKQKGDIDEGYMTLTSTLQSNYEGIFGDVFDCVLTGYIDRELESETIKAGDDEKIIHHATGETRKLYLRGNTFIDAGCRFKDGSVPEYIVFDKPNMAKDFISIMEEGMRLSKSDSTFVPPVKPVVETKKVVVADEIVDEDIVIEDDNTVDEDKNKELIKEIAKKYSKASQEIKDKIKEVLNSHNTNKFDVKLPTKVFENIITILG
jgi:hypothetical protein